MHNTYTAGLLLLLVGGVLGCVEPFVADVDPPSPRPLVVDGRITSGPGPHTVTLSLAAAFEQSLEGVNERVKGARVVIVDDSTDTQVRLRETGTAGEYQTETGELNGVPGHAYSLEVGLPDGRRYRSEPQRMPEPVALDSVFSVFDPSPQPRIKVLAAARDPRGTENYYRWRAEVIREYPIRSFTPPFFCWEFEGVGQVSLRSDRLIEGGRIRRQPVFSTALGVEAAVQNQVNVRQLTLTREAHDFWSKVEEQVEDAGDPFSAPPAPIRGNVVSVQDSTERALGYFEVVGASNWVPECFRQKEFEEAPPPRTSPPECPARGITFERPSRWVCSSSRAGTRTE